MMTIHPSNYVDDSKVEEYIAGIMVGTGYSHITLTREMNRDITVSKVKSKSHFHALVTFEETKTIDEVSETIYMNIKGIQNIEIENRTIVVSKPFRSTTANRIENFDRKCTITSRRIKGAKVKIFIEEIVNAKSSAIYCNKFSGLEVAQFYIKGKNGL